MMMMLMMNGVAVCRMHCEWHLLAKASTATEARHAAVRLAEEVPSCIWQRAQQITCDTLLAPRSNGNRAVLPSVPLPQLYDKPSAIHAAEPAHLGTSQLAAAVLLWNALLTPQRRQSFFYGEVAAQHPAAAADIGAQIAAMPSAAAEVVPPAAVPLQKVWTVGSFCARFVLKPCKRLLTSIRMLWPRLAECCAAQPRLGDCGSEHHQLQQWCSSSRIGVRAGVAAHGSRGTEGLDAARGALGRREDRGQLRRRRGAAAASRRRLLG